MNQLSYYVTKRLIVGSKDSSGTIIHGLLKLCYFLIMNEIQSTISATQWKQTTFCLLEWSGWLVDGWNGLLPLLPPLKIKDFQITEWKVMSLTPSGSSIPSPQPIINQLTLFNSNNNGWALLVFSLLKSRMGKPAAT